MILNKTAKLASDIVSSLCSDVMCEFRENVMFNSGYDKQQVARFDTAETVIVNIIEDTFLTKKGNLKSSIIKKLKEVKDEQ